LVALSLTLRLGGQPASGPENRAQDGVIGDAVPEPA
jgi:hypothetical protein